MKESLQNKRFGPERGHTGPAIATSHGGCHRHGFTSDFEPNNLAAIDTPDASGGFGDMFCCEVCEPW
uniref:Uncharacterized protein n=1 Tax=Zea mays TaxID=4577 RepID=A0A804QMW1_MAIZE